MSAIIYSVACVNRPVVASINNMWCVNGQETGIAHNWHTQSYIISREGEVWVIRFYSNQPCNCGSQMPNTMCSAGICYCG